MTRCGKFCWGNSSCRNKRECSCRCGDLAAYNPNLQEACIGDCQRDSSWENVPSGVKWMLRNFTPEDLFRRYQITVDGFSLGDLEEYELFEEKQKREDKANAIQYGIIAILGVLLLGLMINLLFPDDDTEKVDIKKMDTKKVDAKKVSNSEKNKVNSQNAKS